MDVSGRETHPIMQCIIDNSLEKLKDSLKDNDINGVYFCNEEDDITPLIAAVVFHKEDIFDFLLQEGADPNKVSQNGLTPLHYASTSEAPLVLVKKLLEAKAHPGGWNRSEGPVSTPLQTAAIHNRKDIVQELISAGAPVTLFPVTDPEHHPLNQNILEMMGQLSVSGDELTTSINRSIQEECPNNQSAAAKENWLSQSKVWHQKLTELASLAAKTVGNLRYVNNVKFRIGKGSDGTEVFLGLRKDGTEVAIKRMSRTNYQVLKNEVDLLQLQKLRHHDYIVGYTDFEEDEYFGYLGLQLCEHTLEGDIHKKIEMPREELVKQVLIGLEQLHRGDPSILHLDLKPQNILIDVAGNARVADFGISRRLPEGQTTYRTNTAGTKCWMSKETLKNRPNIPYKKSTDIQVAGMLIYYILSGGHHPFGDDIYCETNILEDKYNLEHVEDVVAKDLIERMIREEPESRPTVKECLSHPLFWNADRRLEYLKKFGNREEVKKRNPSENYFDSSLEAAVGNGSWKTKFPPELLQNVEDKKKPYPENVFGLLRFIRNLHEHYVQDAASLDLMSMFPRLFGHVFIFANNRGWNSESPLKEMFGTLFSRVQDRALPVEDSGSHLTEPFSKPSCPGVQPQESKLPSRK